MRQKQKNLMNARGRLATAAGHLAGRVSQKLRLGSGGMIGGRVALALDPRILAKLSARVPVVLVTGTNGKSTTTGLLRSALLPQGRVASNVNGDNMPAGVATALMNDPDADFAVLEVDEMHLPRIARQTKPDMMVFLNLSRDQLDRVGEMKRVEGRLRKAVHENPGAHVVANADDPLVACAAWDAPRVTWVAAGSGRWNDPAAFPRGGGQIIRDGRDWWVAADQTYRRPDPHWWVEDDTLVHAAGARVPLRLSLPGEINLLNAAQALAAVSALGFDAHAAAEELPKVRDVAGRYQSFDVEGRQVQLLLAKNPAGWEESLHILTADNDQLVLSVNAQVGDGEDTSWLWDVDFESFAPDSAATFYASGERAADLQVRLDYAGLDSELIADPLAAVLACRPGKVAVLANYTALQDLLAAIKTGGHQPVQEVHHE